LNKSAIARSNPRFHRHAKQQNDGTLIRPGAMGSERISSRYAKIDADWK